MAEGKTVDNERIVCPFYLYSSCKDGDECKYTHDATCRNYENVVCCFFLKGICKYGDNCWFLHSTVVENINSSSESRGDENINSTLELRDDELITEFCSRRTANSRLLKLRNDEASHVKYRNLKSVNSIQSINAISCEPNSPNWVNAPEFVPKANKTYSEALKSNDFVINSKPQKLGMEYCMHFFEGVCPYNDECLCLHGDLCELCQKYCLNPFDELQRNRHIELCEKELEQNMEFSFSIQRSLDKTCGICMDVIMEKDSAAERLFGILENCNHVYCLPCIRKWRSIETFEIAQHVEQSVDPIVTRACPECRVSSHFITPSRYWVDSENEKKKLIADYKMALSKKPCKYFKQGDGMCPFGGACFYLHAKRDGTKVILPVPSRRRRQNQDGELDFIDNISLWDFLEVRDDNMILLD